VTTYSEQSETYQKHNSVLTR